MFQIYKGDERNIMVQIGFLGFGEAASHIAAGLHDQGLENLFAYDVTLNTSGQRRNILEQRLTKTCVTPVASVRELLEKAHVIFLIIPAKFARSAALEALPFLTEKHLFCDLTTNRPTVKEELGQAFAEKGMLYVDAAVMGAVPLYRHQTPTLVCGSGAAQMVQIMTPLGMALTDVGLEAGRAVKMKLTRSVFVKGVEALTVEMLMTARRLGIEKEIVAGIEESFQKLGFTNFCGQLVTSGVEHAERRSLEAKECQELEEELGLNSIMMEAAYRKLQWTASLGYAKMEPMPVCKDLESLCQLWEKTGALGDQ